jgi:F-type H+-transporting ATPase subunit b
MQEIVHAFGIDWRLIVIQVFNFAILMGVLWYFLYTPVLKLITDRESKIKKGVTDAEDAEKALKDADTERNRIVKEAHGEASMIVARGTERSEEKAKNLERETAEKLAKQIAAAEAQAEEFKAKAVKEKDAEIAKIALLAAEKLINEKLG